MKKKKNLWVKKRHARVFAFLRFALAPIMRIKYRYKPVKSDLPEGPYLILSNHQASMDPFWVSKSFRFPIYFFASDDIFNLKISPLIEYLVAPIPKSKSLTDLKAVKDVLRVLKEGGAVGIFPEGNRTIGGGQWEVTDASAKLVKVSKVPCFTISAAVTAPIRAGAGRSAAARNTRGLSGGWCSRKNTPR